MSDNGAARGSRIVDFGVGEPSPEDFSQAYASAAQQALSESRESFSVRLGVLILADMLESVLLLFWRHLLFFANQANADPIRPDNLSVSLSLSRAEGSRSTYALAQGKALRTVAADLRGTLQRLCDVAIPEELRGNGQRAEAYFGMLTRRLRELTSGLIGETND